MKISFLILNLNVRGSVRRVVELGNHLFKRDHDVTIYHSDGSKCEWLPQICRGRPETQFAVDEHEAVIFFGHPHYEVVKRVHAQRRYCYILGLNEQDPNLRQALLDTPAADRRTRAFRAAIHDPDIELLGNCTPICNFITQEIGRDCKPVLGGVDFNVFYPRKSRDPNLVLANGSKREIEGTGAVLRVFDMLKNTDPKLRLELYNNKGYSQIELAELYSSCAVFMDAQNHGGWNNTVAEAFACGAPTVCTNIWGNLDFARSGINCWMVEVGNENGMYKAALQLLTNAELANQFSNFALSAIAPYTWDAATDQLEQILEGE